jgi:choline dehydrogenase-like flavoprotein
MNSARYDAVVIGSGFGGSLAARALVQAGLKTVLLERGGWARRDDGDWDQREILLTQRYKSASPMLIKQYGSRDFAQVWPNEVVGGNSVFYGGASLRLRPGDFARWPWGYGDLAPYYAQVEQTLGVHGEAGADPHEPPDVGEYPHPAIELSEPARRVYEAGEALGLQPFKIPLAINFSDDARPRCLRCITCDGFPCKVEAKNDMAATVLAQAQQAGLEIVIGAVAKRLVERGGRVEGVEYVDVASREAFAVSADLVVLAAGALHSPALMLRSGFDHPLIGCFLMRHCNAVTSHVFPYRTNPQQVFHKQVCFADFYEDMRAELGTAVGVVQDIYTPAPPIIRHYAPRGLKTMAGLVVACMQNLLCIAEDDARLENRVTLAGELDAFGMELVQVEHAYSANDCRRRDYLLAKAGAVLRKAGGLLRYSHLVDSFSHALGTLRCAHTPEEGVLDADCRYWGAENLYVTDGSFMPSAGGVNPSLTIAANALRVAERILARR